MKIGLWIILATLSVPTVTQGLTLAEAHSQAIRTAEQIARNDSLILEAEADRKRLVGTVLPSLTLKASELIQDVPGTSGSASDVQGTLVRRSRPSVTLELVQPIFNGFKEFSAIDAAKAFQSQRHLEKKRAVQVLYGELAQAFYAGVQRRKEIELLKVRRGLLVQRIDELRKFEKLGRSRPSERLTFEADKMDLEADLAAIEGNLISVEKLMGFYLGDPAFSSAVLDDNLPEPKSPPEIEPYLLASKSRPDVAALKDATLVAEKGVSVAKGEHWPSLELHARYYPYQVGYLDQIDWDLLFLLELPIYKGGQTAGEVSKARAVYQQAKLTLQEAERSAALEVNQRHAELAAQFKRLEALKDAVELHERNHDLQEKDYRLGLITNLEVLTSLSDLYTSKRNYEVSRIAVKTGLAQLEVAAGLVKGPVE